MKNVQSQSPGKNSSWPEFLKQKRNEVKHPVLKNYYSSIPLTQNISLHNARFVALDFETTGLDSRVDGIVSIGLVPFDLDRIYCNESGYWLVNPQQPLTEESIAIHGLTHTDLAAAPDLGSVYESLLSAMTGRIVVVHYHHIERSFLNQALQSHLGEGIHFPVVDTMVIEARLRDRKPRSIWHALRGRKPRSIRLIDCRNRYGLPHYQSHHALTDAIATAELLQAQVAHHFDKSIPLAQLVV